MTRPYRLIIWGPGEVGGATLRAAHTSGRFEIVGVKVFSPHKHGKDAGELVGIGPIGVRATRSKSEILALDADCVIVTPQPRAVLEGLDADVIALLESGKNVVSTAAYHDVAMPNWFNTARTPTARLRELSRTPGAAARAWERAALWLVRQVTRFRPLDPITDLLLGPIANRRVPARATAARLIEACRRGKSSLHGTGVHPTFMVERQLMRVCHALSKVSHLRFIEAFDFSRAPEGMWGGLHFFGFGRDPRELGPDWVVAKAGDFYYGDLTGNVAHALYGARPGEVRLERAFRGIPAVRDIQVGSTLIRSGSTGALHMTHRGYLGEHCFFTNEEIWYLGPDNAYHGDGTPPGRIPAHGGYAFEITGEPATIRGQTFSPSLRPDTVHPITVMSVNALLDAVGPICEAAPGILIDDARPRYRLAGADDAALPAPAAAVTAAAVTAAATDCIVVHGDPLVPSPTVDDELLTALASGKRVVSLAADGLSTARLEEACRQGGAAIHRIDVLPTLMVGRIALTMARGLSAVRHIRIVEEVAVDAIAPGDAGDTSEPSASGHHAHAIAQVAYALYAAAASSVRVERTLRRIAGDEPGARAAVCITHRGYLGDRPFFTSEAWRRGGARGPTTYTIRIEGDPADLESHWELETAAVDPLAALRAHMAVTAIPALSSATPGILVEDPRPHYQRDDRLEPPAQREGAPGPPAPPASTGVSRRR